MNTNLPDVKLDAGGIRCGETHIFASVPEGVELLPDPTGAGAFLRVATTCVNAFWPAPVGVIAELDRFVACHRPQDPFWMEVAAGTRMAEIPPDTQWLLARRRDGLLVLVVPILDPPLRFSLDGRGGVLRLWADSGDAGIVRASGVGAFLAVGRDPYELQRRGARAVLRRLGFGRLREEKALPDFVDMLGWCTWDAFYQDVGMEKVRTGLETFARGGVPPGFLIIDDGWLSERTLPCGGRRLTAFEANLEKFPGGLAPLVKMAKTEFGLKRLLVWHAVMGYWAGVDGESLASYNIAESRRQTEPAFGKDAAMLFTWYGLACGLPPPDRIGPFYDDFHTALAAAGVDGVKVDNQSSLEYAGEGHGGRVALTRAYRQALEASCRKHFDGRLINCMSNANETHVMCEDSTLLRTSTDFWPGIPSSHGKHLHTNATVSLWFGEFIHPDWDMFQSGHVWGAYHAAGRAISGSPVYVSDKVGQHDFALLRKLVGTDGWVPRCADIARPAPDGLFHDPTREDVALKIFNRNRYGWVLGVFNARYDADQPVTVSTVVSLRDLPGLPPGAYAAYAHRRAEMCPAVVADGMQMSLAQGEWELFTVVPVVKGIAVFGDPAMLNSGGCLVDLERRAEDCRVRLRGGGTLLAARFDAAGNGADGSARLFHIQPDEEGWCLVNAAGTATKG